MWVRFIFDFQVICSNSKFSPEMNRVDIEWQSIYLHFRLLGVAVCYSQTNTDILEWLVSNGKIFINNSLVYYSLDLKYSSKTKSNLFWDEIHLIIERKTKKNALSYITHLLADISVLIRNNFVPNLHLKYWSAACAAICGHIGCALGRTSTINATNKISPSANNYFWMIWNGTCGGCFWHKTVNHIH